MDATADSLSRGSRLVTSPGALGSALVQVPVEWRRPDCGASGEEHPSLPLSPHASLRRWQMAATAAREGVQFVVSLGDNVYDKGVKDVDDPLFYIAFEVSPGVTSCSPLRG